jgi:hypothetical protein
MTVRELVNELLGTYPDEEVLLATRSDNNDIGAGFVIDEVDTNTCGGIYIYFTDWRDKEC